MDEHKLKIINICKNLTMSIKNAKKRHSLEGISGLSTNPSASASGLLVKLKHLMKENNLTQEDLK